VTGLLLLTLAQPSVPADGSELFRGVLHKFGFAPVGWRDNPKVVVVLGDPGPAASRAADACRSVLEGGGSVLIAADRFEAVGRSFPSQKSIGIEGFATGLPGSVDRLTDGLRVDTLASISTPPDAPAVPPRVAVAGGAGRLRRFGFSPDLKTLFALRDGKSYGLCGVGPAGGRAVVLAGNAVFRNRLLAGTFADTRADTGNLEFAAHVVSWLRPPGDGPLPCLFLENGRPADRFDEVDYSAAAAPPVPAPPPPTASDFLRPEVQQKLTDAANEAIDRVQTADRLGGLLARPQRFATAMRLALAVAGLFVAVALVRRARAARAAPPPDPPPPPTAGGVLARRREERLRGGDHSAAVREFLIELFRRHGLPLDEHRHPRRLPPVEADPDIRRQLRTLWEAAYAPPPVSFSRWKELEPMVEAVRAAGAAGRWRFVGGGA
jgi:hypothetical protein